MSDSSLGFNLIGRDVSASRTLRGVGDQATRTSGAFASMGKIAGGVFGGFALTAGIAKVTDFMRDATTAAIEDEKSQVALAKAMENVGAAHAVPQVEDFIKSLMLATGVADDELRPAYQKLVTATGDVAKAQDLLSTAMDVSAGTGKDLNTVSLALAKAANGNIGALTRLGVPIDANIVKTKDFAAATDVLNAKFGGQAAAAAETYGGQLKRLSTAAEEAKETIGYALLDAVASFTDEMGGTDGAVGVVTAFGDGVADWIGDLTAGTHAIKDASEATFDFAQKVPLLNITLPILGEAFEEVGGAAVIFTGSLGMLGKAVDFLSLKDAQYASQIVTTADRTKLMEMATKTFGAEATATGKAVQDAAADIEDMEAAVSALDAAFSAARAAENFRKSLRDLSEELKGNVRTLQGGSDAAFENRDALISLFDEAKAKAKAWVASGKIDANEFESTYNRLAKRVVKQFVEDGFDAGDVKKFLGKQDIWTDPAVLRIKSAAKTTAATAQAAFVVVGTEAAAGVGRGLLGGQGKLNQIARQLITDTKNAMKDAGEIESPSKLTGREVGKPLAEGVGTGLKDGTPDAVKAGVKMVKTVIDEMTKAAAVASGIQDAIAGNAQDFADLVSEAWGEVSGALADAQGELDDFVNGAKDTFTSGIDLGAAWTGQWDSAGKATGISLVQGFENQVRGQEWFQNVIKAIREQGGSDALIQEIMSKGVAIGGALGQGILDQGLVGYFSENLATVEDSATQTANAIVPAFITAGLAAAQAMADSFIATFGPQGAGRTALMELMDDVARSLHRTVMVDVQVAGHAASSVTNAAASIVDNIPHFAEGGIVTGPTIGLMGEAGDEAVIPLDRLGPLGGGGGGVKNYFTIQGSVMTERDLISLVQDGIGSNMRRRGKDPALIGL